MAAMNIAEPAVCWSKPTKMSDVDLAHVHGHIFEYIGVGRFSAYDYEPGSVIDLSSVSETFFKDLIDWLPLRPRPSRRSWTPDSRWECAPCGIASPTTSKAESRWAAGWDDAVSMLTSLYSYASSSTTAVLCSLRPTAWKILTLWCKVESTSPSDTQIWAGPLERQYGGAS